MTDAATMLAAYQSGEIIFTDTYPQDLTESVKDNGLHYVSGYNTFSVAVNMGEKGNEVLKNEAVRKALSLAIDRERMVDIRGLKDEIADTYTPSGLTIAELVVNDWKEVLGIDNVKIEVIDDFYMRFLISYCQVPYCFLMDMK